MPVSAGVLLFAKKQYLAFGWVIVALVLSILTFISYGCYYDCDLFWSVMEQHSLRPQTFWYLFTLFSKPDLGYYQLNDPMMILGLLGGLLSLFLPEEKKDQGKKIYLYAPWVAVFLLFVTIAPVELYGWYKFLAFPLIAVGLGYVWDRLWTGEYQWGILLAPAVLVLMENVFVLAVEFSLLRKVLITVLFLPVLFWSIRPDFVKKPIYVYWAGTLLVVTIFLQVWWAVKLLQGF